MLPAAAAAASSLCFCAVTALSVAAATSALVVVVLALTLRALAGGTTSALGLLSPKRAELEELLELDAELELEDSVEEAPPAVDSAVAAAAGNGVVAVALKELLKLGAAASVVVELLELELLELVPPTAINVAAAAGVASAAEALGELLKLELLELGANGVGTIVEETTVLLLLSVAGAATLVGAGSVAGAIGCCCC